ncbi:MAG: acyltransferase family protein [Xanthobacter sp.]
MSLAYRPDIDGLRAIAVGSVLLFHAGFAPFSGGFIGVDVFFVISGYLITSIIYREMLEKRFSLVDFYDRRVRRILPVLFVVLATTTLAAFFLLLPAQMEEYAASLGPAVLFYANIHFMQLQSYFAPTAETMPLLHLWSLAIEEQFYIVFPLVLFLLARFTPRWVTVSALVVIGLASLIHAQMELGEDARRAFYLLTSRVWEFLIGGLVAIAPLPKAGRRVATLLGGIGLLAILAPVFIYARSTPFPGVSALPPVLGTALVIYAGGCASGLFVGRLLSLKGVVQVGRMSYSLYLWHWPLLALAYVYKGRAPSDLEAGLLLAAAVVLSYLSWRYVEMPLRKPTTFLGRRSLRLACAAGLIALTFSGARAMEQAGGIVWPLSPFGREANALLARRLTPESPGRCKDDPKTIFDGGGRSCSLGPDAGTAHFDVLVWGDSHAAASFRGLSELIVEDGLTARLLTLAGCPPLLGVRPVVREEQGEKCAAFNNAVMRQVEKARPRLVILVGRWSLWTHFSQRNVALVSDELSGSKAPSADGSRAAFTWALEQTIAKLRSYGANVLVVGQGPEFERDPVECVLRNEYAGRDSSSCFSVPRTEALIQNLQANAIIAQQVKKASEADPGVSSVSLADLFCDEKNCYAVRERTFLYRDGNHISRIGSPLLQGYEKLREKVKAASGAKPLSAETE